MARDAGGFEKSGGMVDKRTFKARLRKARLFVFLILLVSLFVFVVITMLAIYNEGYPRFVSVFGSVKPVYLVASLAVMFFEMSFRYPKWELFLGSLGVRIGRFKNYMIYMSMYAMDITPGRSGRLVSSYLVNKIAKVRFGKTAPAVVADIFTDFIGYMLLTISIAMLVGRYVLISLVLAFILLIPFAIINNEKLFNYIKGRFGDRKRLASFFEFGNMYFESRKLIGRGVYIVSLVFSISSEIMNALALYLIILGFGISLPISSLPIIIFIYSSSALIGIVSAIPGALGVVDFTILGYLTILLGIAYSVASAITILFRFATLWFVESVGIAASAYTLRYWKD